MTSVTHLDDTLVQMNIRGTTLKDRTKHIQILRKLAHKIETEPCIIHCQMNTDNNETLAQFEFCCVAEKIIFELNCAFNSQYKVCVQAH